jgi:xanthine dehydrogenase YagS FAD-binding subunit
MRKFDHVNARTLVEAASALAGGKATIIAGGCDLIGRLKEDILPTYPETLVNIKTIPGLDYIKEAGGVLKIGATTTLADIAEDATVRQKYSALAQSANRVASPTIRFMGTIGGNICQLHRCWYFRNHDNRFNCTRKGGKTCFAMAGDNRYHSILGAVDGCIAVHPSDIAPALVALNAKIVTSKKRSINAQDFWAVKGPQSTILAVDEIVTEIQIPSAPAGSRSAFLKFALRKSIDFPIVNCAALVSRDTTRICLNAVAPIPYRAVKAEETIAGEAINEGNAEAAGEAAVSAAKPFPATKYKVQIAKIMVKRTLLACA